jgi:hypothetical protein
MVSTHAPAPSTRRPSAAARRFGYLVAIAAHVVMLWIAHRLLEWGWPGFLTEDFAVVLGVISASLVAGMVVNAGFVLHDEGRFRALGDLVTAAFALAVSLRLWSVFPFDFTGYETDWSWLLRAGLAVGIGGTVIAIIVQLVRLIGPLAPFDD